MVLILEIIERIYLHPVPNVTRSISHRYNVQNFPSFCGPLRSKQLYSHTSAVSQLLIKSRTLCKGTESSYEPFAKFFISVLDILVL